MGVAAFYRLQREPGADSLQQIKPSGLFVFIKGKH